MKEIFIWDAHSCVPLSKKTNLSCLRGHYDVGVNVLSINVGMDMNPLTQVIELIATFRRQIEQSDFMVFAKNTKAIDQAIIDKKLAIRFDLEGAKCCQDNPDMIYLLDELGVKQIHFAYNRNNALGGGCHDTPKPLTALGREFVDAINGCGILMDVSHTGFQTSMDIFSYSDKPVIFSHANVFNLAPHGRNITDEQIDACVATGGIVCVNGVGRFLGDDKLKVSSLVNHIDYLVQRIGPENVGIGLDYCYDAGEDDMPEDFDRGYWWPESAGYENGLSLNYMPPDAFSKLPEKLSNLGYSAENVMSILGKNMYNLVRDIEK